MDVGAGKGKEGRDGGRATDQMEGEEGKLRCVRVRREGLNVGVPARA